MNLENAFSAHEELLLRENGFQGPYKVLQLKAGRNNQVFQVSERSGAQVVIKRYFQHENDQRDRLEHEWRFLEYAYQVARHLVPRPLARCDDSRVALLEWVEGDVFTGPIAPEEVHAAISFSRLLNPEDREDLASNLPIAADACFTWEDHLGLLKRRLERLEQIRVTEVREFVRRELIPIAAETIQTVSGIVETGEAMAIGERIVSPSDFGYHNALRMDSRPPCFLDFEYAGWDGAGKMVADFFSQPRIPVSLEFLGDFENALRPSLSPRELNALQRGWPALLAIHALKWCCILLNDFLSVDGERRQFAGIPAGQSWQFKKTQAYYEAVCVPRVNTCEKRMCLLSL